MKVTLISFTDNPEKLVSLAARVCYNDGSIDELIEKNRDSSKFVEMLMELGHESPMEHANFTFAIEGVSRVLLAQLTRHRIASFSVKSQRYVSEKDSFPFVVPKKVEANKKAKELYIKAMNESMAYYRQIFDILKQDEIENLKDSNLSENMAVRKAEKNVAQDARFVLPGSCKTNVLVTMNARSLKNFFKLRCCERAQWEIRELAYIMLKLVYRVAPTIFESAGPGCIFGRCTEGKMSCGRSEEVKEKIEQLKR